MWMIGLWTKFKKPKTMSFFILMIFIRIVSKPTKVIKDHIVTGMILQRLHLMLNEIMLYDPNREI